METIQTRRKHGIHSGALRAWGMLFAAAGIVGRSILQLRLLGLNHTTSEQLLELMGNSDTMLMVTVALVLQAVETCAVPIFTFLMVEGFQHTSNFKNYLLRVLGIAVLSEIPYNLAMSGKLVDLSSRNPVFGIVLGLIVLYFYRMYGEKSGKNTCIKLGITLAALVWVSMLDITYGGCVVLIAAVLWAFRAKTMLRNVAGASMTILCGVSSVFFMMAPMSFLIIHNYNGEEGNTSQRVNYLAYPVILLAVVLAGALFV